MLRKIPTIVVVAYNRHDSLKRLLSSISRSNFEGYDNNIQLIISIDFSDNKKVRETAKQFVWKYGNKNIIAHTERLGLRKHVLSCGDLTKKFGSVIILEDDLFVSSEFYRYSTNALDFYQDDEDIAGISLYNYRYVDTIGCFFFPSITNGDVYYVKFPSSWGQAWDERQWEGFRSWIERGHDNNCSDIDAKLPVSVVEWPPTSWKKSFARYLVDTDKYFVFPTIALSTNMGDAGQHLSAETLLHQVPIAGSAREFSFTGLSETVSYDQFFELESRSLAMLNFPNGFSRGLEFDLYGQKPFSLLKDKLVVSSKRAPNHLRSFGMELLPHELNIVNEVKGKDFFLGNGSEMQFDLAKSRKIHLKHLTSSLGGFDLVKMLGETILKKLIGII